MRGLIFFILCWLLTAAQTIKWHFLLIAFVDMHFSGVIGPLTKREQFLIVMQQSFNHRQRILFTIVVWKAKGIKYPGWVEEVQFLSSVAKLGCYIWVISSLVRHVFTISQFPVVTFLSWLYCFAFTLYPTGRKSLLKFKFCFALNFNSANFKMFKDLWMTAYITINRIGFSLIFHCVISQTEPGC